MKKIISLALIIMTALFSCKKEDTKPVTKSDFLTSGTWAVTDVVSDEDGDGTYETHDFPDFDSVLQQTISILSIQMENGK